MPINHKDAPMSHTQSLRDKNWQRAQQRVLSYLKFLNLPSVQNLELALKALKQAQSRMEDAPDSHPITESWRALHSLLAEQALPASTDLLASEGQIPPLTRIPDLCKEVQSMPALNRGSMVPGKLR